MRYGYRRHDTFGLLKMTELNCFALGRYILSSPLLSSFFRSLLHLHLSWYGPTFLLYPASLLAKGAYQKSIFSNAFDCKFELISSSSWNDFLSQQHFKQIWCENKLETVAAHTFYQLEKICDVPFFTTFLLFLERKWITVFSIWQFERNNGKLRHFDWALHYGIKCYITSILQTLHQRVKSKGRPRDKSRGK